jgi:hypothetical protein
MGFRCSFCAPAEGAQDAVLKQPKGTFDLTSSPTQPLKWLAEMAGDHRVTLYRAIWFGRISDDSRAALSPYC